MKKILVATDFSERSDRAIRRASLLARSFAASVMLVHVVDDDQPRRKLMVDIEAATALLVEQSRTMRDLDGIDCDFRVLQGSPHEGIAAAVSETNPDLLVIGPHRKASLKDVFVGTTAERVIRLAQCPVLMVNGPPVGSYRHILLAADMSAACERAVQASRALGLEKLATISAVHIFDATASGLMVRASMTKDEIASYIDEEQEAARIALKEFLKRIGLLVERQVLKLNENTPAVDILRAARTLEADLVVVGTHGRTGLGRLLLGSVAEKILATADRDVLAVPSGS